MRTERTCSGRMRRLHAPMRWVFGAITLLGLVLGTPRGAWAHAHLRRSEPSAGASVTAPHVIRLWFSEAPELSLTTVRVTDSTGASIDLGAPVHDGADALSVLLSIRRELAPGRYEVRWRTAAVDGHPASGRFSFRVAAPALPALPVPAASPGATDSLAGADDSTAMGERHATPQDASFVLVRLVSYASLLLLVGAVVFRGAVLPRVAGAEGMDARGMQRILAGGAAAAAVVFVVTSAVRLAMQSRMMRDASMSVAQLEDMAMATQWGGAWRMQLGAGAAALIGATLAWRGRRSGWTLAALACVVASLGIALGGHAATVERYRSLSVLDDALHVLAASAWLGTLFWLAAAGLGAPLRDGTRRADHVAALVGAFSPVALLSAAVVALTGVVTAWQRLDRVADLWTTPYGQVLFRKLVLVGVVALVGAYNWRRVRPALGTDAATGRLRRSMWTELCVGLLVLLATAVLVATPTR